MGSARVWLAGESLLLPGDGGQLLPLTLDGFESNVGGDSGPTACKGRLDCCPEGGRQLWKIAWGEGWCLHLALDGDFDSSSCSFSPSSVVPDGGGSGSCSGGGLRCALGGGDFGRMAPSSQLFSKFDCWGLLSWMAFCEGVGFGGVLSIVPGALRGI
eukprot:Gb_29670 [translate_table: standard]